jgi:hypothetical protein
MNEKGKQPSAPPSGPKKNLYRVTVMRVLYVVAEGPEDAKEQAKKAEPNEHELFYGQTLATPGLIEADGWVGANAYGTDVDEFAEDACKRLNLP